jgi:hypothetical protein
MSNVESKIEASDVAKKLMLALKSAEKVVQDLNSAHEKKLAASATNRSGSRVHAKA